MANVLEKTLSCCGVCGDFWKTKEAAEKCCTCDTCGLVVLPGSDNYSGRHKECQQKANAEAHIRLIEKAEKLETWDGPIMDGDTFYHSFEAYIEHLDEDLEPGDKRPEWVFTPDEQTLEPLDGADIVENLFENLMCENLDSSDADGLKEFKAACKKFNEANRGIKAYLEGNTRVVRVPPREKEIA